SRIATFAREYSLILLRLQKSRIVENPFLPKTVTIRYKQTPRGPGINSGYMNLCGRTGVGNSAWRTLVRHYYIATMSYRCLRGIGVEPQSAGRSRIGHPVSASGVDGSTCRAK